jgi:hypothetical protein
MNQKLEELKLKYSNIEYNGLDGEEEGKLLDNRFISLDSGII